MAILRRLIDHLKEEKENIEETDDEFLRSLQNKEFKFQQDGACESLLIGSNFLILTKIIQSKSSIHFERIYRHIHGPKNQVDQNIHPLKLNI